MKIIFFNKEHIFLFVFVDYAFDRWKKQFYDTEYNVLNSLLKFNNDFKYFIHVFRAFKK